MIRSQTDWTEIENHASVGCMDYLRTACQFRQNIERRRLGLLKHNDDLMKWPLYGNCNCAQFYLALTYLNRYLSSMCG